MALRFIDSFDHYATAHAGYKWQSNSGAFITTNGRNGTSCMETGGGTSNNFWARIIDLQSTWIIGFAVQFSSIYAGVAFLSVVESGVATHVTLQLDASGHVQVTRGGTVLGTGTTILLPGVYYYIELKTTIHDTTGVAAVKINGVTEISLTGQDTRNGGSTGQADRIQWFGGGSVAGTFRVDDVYICDGTGSSPTNDFLGDVRVQCLTPSGNGNSSQLVGNDGNSTDNYLLVDEATPNSDTDYVESSTVGDKDTYAFSNLTPSTGTVFGVQPVLFAKKTDAGTRKVCSVARLSATEVDSADAVLTTSYLMFLDIREAKPGGGTWSISDVNSAEFGVKVTA